MARSGTPTDGLLNLDKPGGWTSRRVVDRVARLAAGAKAGHAGTLDPLASGVLVVSVGAATRLFDYFQRMPKRYRAAFLLGRHSSTEDIEGEIASLDNPPVPTIGQIRAAAQKLTGRIQQRPPAYSAVKIEGRRAYRMARQGQSFDLETRTVEVYRIDIEGYEYPELRLEIECGSGTYVRSLGRDLATSLGTAAVMSALTRTAVGDFRIEEAVDVESLTAENFFRFLLSPLRAVPMLSRVELTAEEVFRVRSGQPITKAGSAEGSQEIAAVDPSGRLVAILVRRGDDLLAPMRNF